MQHPYRSFRRYLPLVLPALLGAGRVQAQAPVITGTVPLANALAASGTVPVTVSFSQPLLATSGTALKVFSAQHGGLRSRGTTPATVNGSNLIFNPGNFPFAPGETVQYTATTAAASTGGNLARPRVGQFRVATGAGPGTLAPGSEVATMSQYPMGVSLGDLDGDGDLDMAVACFRTSQIYTFHNNGRAGFTLFANVTLTDNLTDVAMGDLDGDLDLAVTCNDTYAMQGKVFFVFNNGSGGLAPHQNVAVRYWPTRVLLGDVDGDGDLDMLTANTDYPASTSLSLNDGSGTFGSPQLVSLAGNGPTGIALGDVDSDGDLDLLATNLTTAAGLVSVRFNNGSGAFSGSQTVAVGTAPQNLTLGDLDGDGDLDLLTANSGSNDVSVRLNDGSGNFSGTTALPMSFPPNNLSLGDLDGDGDLDLLIVTYDAAASGNTSRLVVRLNNGSGVFTGTQETSAGVAPTALALGDLDGDGDLDVATANRQNSTASVRLNQPVATATFPTQGSAWALYPNPARGGVTISGAAPRSQVEVMDALGRTVLVTPTDAAGQADCRLAPGLYIVRHGNRVQRLTVE